MDLKCATSYSTTITIYYTTNGTDPDTSSTLYDRTITLVETTLIKAKAFKHGWQPSNVVNKIISFPPVSVSTNSPLQYKFNPPYPNPFNAITTIKYEIPTECHVELVIYDILGRKIAVLQNDRMTAGTNEAIWDGRHDNGTWVGSGVYLYFLKADKFTSQGKMLLIK